MLFTKPKYPASRIEQGSAETGSKGTAVAKAPKAPKASHLHQLKAIL